jgi:uncharacterized protein (DUF1697 family)
MGELRALFESLGHSDVSTFIRSGNVIFTSRARPDPATFERAFGDRFGFSVPVVLRTHEELEKVLGRNPFDGVDLSKLHVGFMAARPPDAAVAGIDAASFHPEELAIRGNEVYLHLPNGMGRAKLPAYADRQLKTPLTIRNWGTVTKLCEMSRAASRTSSGSVSR